MTSAFIPQEGDDYQQVIPEASQQSIEDFINSLESDFEYPAFSHLSATPDDSTASIVGEEGDEEGEEIEDAHDELDPSASTPPPGEAPPASDPNAPTTVKVRGQDVLLSDIERLYEFDQFLQSNPEAAQRVQQAVTPQQPALPAAEQTPPPNEVTPPDFLDLDDPVHKFFWEQSLAQKTQLAQFARQAEANAQAEVNRRAVEETNTAIARFRSVHPNFNDDQIDALRQHGAKMNIIDSVLATTPNPVDAIHRVLDLAALDNPDLRTLYLAPPEEPKTPTQRQRSNTRKRQLNALGGSSGSVPRTAPVSRPMSDREAIDQFAKELSDSYQQN